MDSVVVSLGGSILVPGEKDSEYISALARLMRSLSRKYSLILVCGGGKPARYYISVGRDLLASPEELDEMGIAVTRLNARLLQLALKEDASASIPQSIEEAEKELRKGKIVVMGGTVPGHTTDAVSAMVAASVNAKRIVNATSVEAAYSADPKKHPDAQRYDELTHGQLYDLVNRGTHEAGPSNVFDRLGAEIAMEHNIPIYIIDGRDLKEVEAAVKGEKIKGTLVSN
jgi:uridylate kinase